MERGFVEYLADPALERCLEVHLCDLGIPKEHKTDKLLSRISSFVSVVGVYVGLPSEVSSHDR